MPLATNAATLVNSPMQDQRAGDTFDQARHAEEAGHRNRPAAGDSSEHPGELLQTVHEEQKAKDHSKDRIDLRCVLRGNH